MEQLSSPTKDPLPRRRSVVQHIRKMGLRCLLAITVVSAPVVTGPRGLAEIAAKEMLRIVLVVAIWGSSWRGGTVCFHCDNLAAVEMLNNQSASDPLACHHLCAACSL